MQEYYNEKSESLVRTLRVSDKNPRRAKSRSEVKNPNSKTKSKEIVTKNQEAGELCIDKRPTLPKTEQIGRLLFFLNDLIKR